MGITQEQILMRCIVLMVLSMQPYNFCKKQIAPRRQVDPQVENRSVFSLSANQLKIFK